MTTLTDYQERHRRESLPKRKALILQKKRILAALRKVKAKSARVEYSGSDDSLEEGFAKVFRLPMPLDGAEFEAFEKSAMADSELGFATVKRTEEYGSFVGGEWKTVQREVEEDLPKALVAFCESWFEIDHDGFWNNDGGQGVMIVDVKTGVFKLHHEDNFVSHEDSEDEL